MKKNKLGLPLEYQKYPEYFDAWNVNNETDAKNAIIEGLLKKHKVKSVLDLTCGTGSQVFYLAKQSYQVTGADFSPELLKIARKKARTEKVDVKFIDGDMRKLKVGTFDAVITIFNAIGHVTKADFEKTLKNIHSNLKEGGIYIFDILNLQVMKDKTVAELSCYVHKQIKDTQFHVTQCSTIDRKTGWLTSYDIYMIQKKAQKPQIFEHHSSLQLYTAKELRAILSHNGFETIEQWGMDGETFISNKTLNILTVAKKKAS